MRWHTTPPPGRGGGPRRVAVPSPQPWSRSVQRADRRRRRITGISGNAFGTVVELSRNMTAFVSPNSPCVLSSCDARPRREPGTTVAVESPAHRQADGAGTGTHDPRQPRHDDAAPRDRPPGRSTAPGDRARPRGRVAPGGRPSGGRLVRRPAPARSGQRRGGGGIRQQPGTAWHMGTERPRRPQRGRCRAGDAEPGSRGAWHTHPAPAGPGPDRTPTGAHYSEMTW